MPLNYSRINAIFHLTIRNSTMISTTLAALFRNRSVFFVLTLFCLTALSCSKDSGVGSGFQVTYVLEGPAVVAQVQYTPTITDPYNIPDEYEETVTPPWRKTVSLIEEVRGAGFSVSIDEGKPGATYKISILDKDGDMLESAEFALDSDGYGVQLINYYR